MSIRVRTGWIVFLAVAGLIPAAGCGGVSQHEEKAVVASAAEGVAADAGSGDAVPAGSAAAPRDAKKINLDFSLPQVDGKPFDLKQIDGTIRIVDFWATWCPPCREAIPSLNALYRKYKDKGVSIVGISVDENPKVLKAFDGEIHIEYQSLLTSKKAEEAFGGIVGLPTTFVLDRQGRIYRSYIGEVERSTLEDDLRALLAAS
jgi:thiol-disulfide isomerase/thioredoxin